jgi:hypothetical protein
VTPSRVLPTPRRGGNLLVANFVFFGFFFINFITNEFGGGPLIEFLAAGGSP